MDEVSNQRKGGRRKLPPISVPSDTVEIDVKELRQLRISDAKLRALYDAGVDNWEGYDYAQEIMNHEYKVHLM